MRIQIHFLFAPAARFVRSGTIVATNGHAVFHCRLAEALKQNMSDPLARFFVGPLPKDTRFSISENGGAACVSGAGRVFFMRHLIEEAE